MQLSIYSHLFEDKGKFYIYTSETNFFSEISESLYKAIKNRSWSSLPENVIQELLNRKILVYQCSKYNYFNSQQVLFNAQKYNSTNLGLVIVPTTACNFDCPYCFEPKKTPKLITKEIMSQLIEFVMSFKDVKKLNITWYGGEPLLAFEEIKQIHNMLSQDGIPKIGSQSIVTNGLLFTQEVIDFFKATGLGNIQITLDGTKDRHNSTRCLKVGHAPTYDIILENVDRILSQLTETSLSIRVNIDKTNYKDYAELYKYFANKYSGNKRLHVYPGLIRVETEDSKSLTCDCFASDELFELNQLIRAEGINRVVFPKKEHRGCMVHSLYSYIIGPEGELYKCWNDVSDPSKAVGTIKSAKLFGSTRLLDFMTETTPFNLECKECRVFPICGGGCSYFRLKNVKEGCHFSVCSPYKDEYKLRQTLLKGIKPELQ